MEVSLEILSGEVRLTRVDTSEVEIIQGAVELYPGDLIETLREARARLDYPDGTQMRIKPRTLVEVQPNSLRVFKGRTWYRFVRRGSEFRIETPTLVAGIRGTEFEIAVNSRKRSYLMVMSGAVAVECRNSNTKLLLREGFATQSEPGKRIRPAYQFDVERRNRDWQDNAWHNGDAVDDINARFIRYLNLRTEYGDEDSRTIEALERLNELRNNR